MNQSELIGYNYLQDKYKYKKEQIKFNSTQKTPDFEIEGKTETYEVKPLYGKTLVFTSSQMYGLTEDTKIIVVSEGRVKEEFLWKDRNSTDYEIKIYNDAKKYWEKTPEELKVQRKKPYTKFVNNIRKVGSGMGITIPLKNVSELNLQRGEQVYAQLMKVSDLNFTLATPDGNTFDRNTGKFIKKKEEIIKEI